MTTNVSTWSYQNATPTDWNNVEWSDETKLERFGNKHSKSVWCKKSEWL